MQYYIYDRINDCYLSRIFHYGWTFQNISITEYIFTKDLLFAKMMDRNEAEQLVSPDEARTIYKCNLLKPELEIREYHADSRVDSENSEVQM